METVACPDCDLLQRLPELPPGGKARCPRCGQTLATEPTDPLDRALALTLTAAIVFIVANTAPLMGLSAVGRHASTTIVGGAYQMWVQGQEVTAVIVAFCAVIAPGSYILFMLTVLLAVRRPTVRPTSPVGSAPVCRARKSPRSLRSPLASPPRRILSRFPPPFKGGGQGEVF